MDGEAGNFRTWVAVLGVGCAACGVTSMAAPPAVTTPAHANLAVARPLDLRAPANPMISASGATAASGRWSFRPADRFEDDERWGGLFSGAAPPRSTGRPEAIVQHFRREGVPLARLWENHSALLSLGLNPKGKPGLWLVQKTR